MLPTSIPILSIEFDQNLLFFEFFTSNVELKLVFMADKALINLILLLVSLTILVPYVYFNSLPFCQVGQQAVHQTLFSSSDASHVNIELLRW